MYQDYLRPTIPLGSSMAAQIYQILGRALRQIEFSTVQVIPRLPVGNLMELYGKSQLLPQLARSGIGMPPSPVRHSL